MAFGGGGGGALQNHVHNSVPLQGGPLDFANDTIASLNAGSTTFSDGAALQELVIGNAGDTMVVNGAGTAPEWGAGSGPWSSLGSVSSAVAVAELSLAVGAVPTPDIIQVLYNCSCDASAGNSYMSAGINSVVTPNYRSMWSYSSGGAFTTGTSNGVTQWRINGSDLWNYATNNMFGTLFLYKPQAVADAIDMVSFRCINGNLSPSGSSYISTSFGSCLETDISSIQLKVDGANISGSFSAAGMNY